MYGNNHKKSRSIANIWRLHKDFRRPDHPNLRKKCGWWITEKSGSSIGDHWNSEDFSIFSNYFFGLFQKPYIGTGCLFTRFHQKSPIFSGNPRKWESTETVSHWFKGQNYNQKWCRWRSSKGQSFYPLQPETLPKRNWTSFYPFQYRRPWWNVSWHFLWYQWPQKCLQWGDFRFESCQLASWWTSIEIWKLPKENWGKLSRCWHQGTAKLWNSLQTNWWSDF